MVANFQPSGRTNTPRILQLLAVPILILLAGLLAYSNSFQGVFLLDDHPMIVDNPSIRQVTPISQFVFEGGLRKLPMLSFAVNYALGGLDPMGYHVFNTTIHLLAALCLYGLICVTFKSTVWSLNLRSQATLLAFFTSLLWIVHPLNTQAVNYIVQRIESMMGLAMFLFLWLYACSHFSNYRRTLLLAAWFVFCAGLACKEVMVMSLPVAMLYDRAFLSLNWRDAFRSRGWFWLACTLPLTIAGIYIIPAVLGSDAAVGLGLQSVTPWQYLTTQPEVILHYLKLVVLPWPQVFDYGWKPEAQQSIILATSAVLLVAVIGLCWLFKFKPQIAFWGLAAVLVLLPTSSFVPLQDLAVEHRMYVPLAFLLTLMVLSLFALGSRVFRDQPTLINSAVCLGFAVMLVTLTLGRNQDYTSEIRMWQDVVSKTVDSGSQNMLAGRAYSNLGQAYANSEQWPKSIECLTKALECQQFASSVHGNLTRAYVATGEGELAKVHCAKALGIEPNSARLRQQAGLIETTQGNFKEAEKHFRAAHQLAPADTIIVVNLAQCLLQLNNIFEAEALFRQAIAIDAQAAEPHKRLVDLLIQKPDYDAAFQAATEFAIAFPRDPRCNLQLGMLWASKGEHSKAIEQLSLAAKFDPPPAEANFLLGKVLGSQKDFNAARQCFETELKYYPKNVDALMRLAELVARDNPLLAVAYFQQVTDLTPRYWQARYNIASIQAQLGKKELARDQLALVLKLNPECEPAKQLLQTLD